MLSRQYCFGKYLNSFLFSSTFSGISLTHRSPNILVKTQNLYYFGAFLAVSSQIDAPDTHFVVSFEWCRRWGFVRWAVLSELEHSVLSRESLVLYKKLFKTSKCSPFLIKNTVGICRLNKNQLFWKKLTYGTTSSSKTQIFYCFLVFDDRFESQTMVFKKSKNQYHGA